MAWAASLILCASVGRAENNASGSNVGNDRAGFYLRGQLGGGFAYASASSSLSNGFLQPIESSARGAAWPSGSLRLGGTLWRGVVLGGRFGVAMIYEPTFETLNQEFVIKDLKLSSGQIGAFAAFYPDPAEGLHFDLELSLASVFVDQTSDGAFDDSSLVSSERQLGPGVGIETGYDVWLTRVWAGGLSLRAFALPAVGERSRTIFFMSELAVAVTFY